MSTKPRNGFIDESHMKVEGEPLEYVPDKRYTNNLISTGNLIVRSQFGPVANGLTVEEIEYDEYLAEVEKQALRDRIAEE